nr:hypothetical protein [Tanacetum cinerariifolium]GEX99486.1 hypothetical protein [Tanacetum cinerariifolium]
MLVYGKELWGRKVFWQEIWLLEPKPDEEANNNPDERLNGNIIKSLFGCDSGATWKKEDGQKTAMVRVVEKTQF